eukprot:GHVU01042384.1.p1 GENE.GHVU01042384.1~~GHVU01042384.1.p1  ORF type:complete len:209 (-),score=5.45 GHVU01042384.1:118-744(-)
MPLTKHPSIHRGGLVGPLQSSCIPVETRARRHTRTSTALVRAVRDDASAVLPACVIVMQACTHACTGPRMWMHAGRACAHLSSFPCGCAYIRPCPTGGGKKVRGGGRGRGGGRRGGARRGSELAGTSLSSSSIVNGVPAQLTSSSLIPKAKRPPLYYSFEEVTEPGRMALEVQSFASLLHANVLLYFSHCGDLAEAFAQVRTPSPNPN